MKSVDLKALAIALEDGRVQAWLDTNGYVCIMNTKSKRLIKVASMHDMEYDPWGDTEDSDDYTPDVALYDKP